MRVRLHGRVQDRAAGKPGAPQTRQRIAPGHERDEALKLANKITAKSPLTIKTGKEAFYRQLEMSLADAYTYTSEVMVENMLARDAEEGISAFIVPTDSIGYEVARVEDKLGQRASDTCQIVFNELRLSVDHRLGEEGEGYRIALSNLEGGRIGIASQSVGMALLSTTGTIPYSYDPKNGSVSVTIKEALKGTLQRALVWATDSKTGRRVEAMWTFRLPEPAAALQPAEACPAIDAPIIAPAVDRTLGADDSRVRASAARGSGMHRP